MSASASLSPSWIAIRRSSPASGAGGTQDFQHRFGFGSVWRDNRAIAREQSGQALQALLRVALRPGRIREQRGERGIMHGRVLAQVQRGQMKTEAVDPAQ